LHAAVTPSGGLEIVVTLPGCPRPMRRRPRRVHPRQASPSLAP
jgi:hypothetical protein